MKQHESTENPQKAQGAQEQKPQMKPGEHYPLGPSLPPVYQEGAPGQHPELMVNPLYQRVTESEAEAYAWVFEGPGKLGIYYYRHPPLGPKEIRCRVLYSGISSTDIELGRGLIKGVRYPYCAGHEIVAEVIAVGKEASKFKVHEKVLIGATRNSCMNCDMCTAGEHSLCTGLPDEEKCVALGKYFGGFSTHIQLPELHVHRLPEGLNPETAAPLMYSGLTAFHALQKYAKKGMRVGMIGIGGVGQYAVEFARAMELSVDVFLTNSTLDSFQSILNMGVEQVMNLDEDHAMSLLQNKLDLILYMLPTSLPVDLMNKMVLSLKPGGRLVLIGMPPDGQNLELSFMPLVMRDIQVSGVFSGGWKDSDSVIKFALAHKTEISNEFFEFDEFPKALNRFIATKHHPKMILRIDQVSRRFQA